MKLSYFNNYDIILINLIYFHIIISLYYKYLLAQNLLYNDFNVSIVKIIFFKIIILLNNIK